MSTWTGVNGGGPESTTTTVCSWTFCTCYVPRRFADAGLLMCREHALLTWAIVNDQLAAGETFQPAFGEPLGQFEESDDGPAPIGYVYYVRTGGRIKIGSLVGREACWSCRLVCHPSILHHQPR